MHKRTLIWSSAVLVALLFMPGSIRAEDNPDKVAWRTDIETALKEAGEKGTPIVLEISCEWNTG